MTGREQCSYYRGRFRDFFSPSGGSLYISTQFHQRTESQSPEGLCVGEQRRAQKGDRRTRDDPIILFHRFFDVRKRMQVRKSWVRSLAVFHVSFQLLVVSSSLHPEGTPDNFTGPKLGLRNEIRPEKLLDKT